MPSTGTPPPTSADQALDRLARVNLREHSMDTLLQTVVDLTKDVLPGHVETSISVLVNDKASTAVSTGPLATDLDESQYGRGYGPCLHAAATGETVEIADARTETRWPDYMARAVERGSLSSLSVPLPGSDLRAALNIYAREAWAFDDDARAAADRFAPYAAVSIVNMHSYQGARDLADNLQAAMQSRSVIEQAKGILIERHKLTPDQAFQALAQASMHSNRKLRDVAEHLVLTGELTP
jgi:GAF domain-containing protein